MLSEPEVKDKLALVFDQRVPRSRFHVSGRRMNRLTERRTAVRPYTFLLDSRSLLFYTGRTSHGFPIR